MGLPVGCRGVGIDMDAEAVAYGQERFAHLELACGTAEQLPYADASFDLVVSRVSLCYTHIAPALAEVQRVLRPGGRLWCTLHDWRRTRQEWWRAARQGEWKDLVFRSYVFANGLGFAATGRALAFPGLGRCEFFQTESGMRRALARAGLRGAAFEHGRHFICTAEK
jgi:SAM-dependent methyltransferase